MARAYKPHRELFEKALAVSGYPAGQAVHIGDSLTSDVAGARAAGIAPVLLDRSGAHADAPDCPVVSSLPAALALLGAG